MTDYSKFLTDDIGYESEPRFVCDICRVETENYGYTLAQLMELADKHTCPPEKDHKKFIDYEWETGKGIPYPERLKAHTSFRSALGEEVAAAYEELIKDNLARSKEIIDRLQKPIEHKTDYVSFPITVSRQVFDQYTEVEDDDTRK